MFTQLLTTAFRGERRPAGGPAAELDWFGYDQLGALDLVLNALVLFNTRYTDAAGNQLRWDGFDVRDEDVARLSPFVRQHINMLGRYSFKLPYLPYLPGGMRPLRNPNSAEEA